MRKIINLVESAQTDVDTVQDRCYRTRIGQTNKGLDNMTSAIREVTNKIHAAMEEGTLTPIQVAEAALRFLSESDVVLMAHNEEFFLNEDADGWDAPALTKVYEDEDELADEFDTYCYENKFKLTRYWKDRAEDGGISAFAEEIADEGFTTIGECIRHFCK